MPSRDRNLPPTIEELMAHFEFTTEDLEANKSGTISDRQREELDGLGSWIVGAISVGIALLFLVNFFGRFADSAFSFRLWMSLASIATLGFPIWLAYWWFRYRYPLGEDRVNLLIGEARWVRPKGRGTEPVLVVGNGIGGRALPPSRAHTIIPEGTMVRLYWNSAVLTTIVHSIEPAQPGDVPNSRSASGRKRFAIVALLLAVVVSAGLEFWRIDAQQREFNERVIEPALSESAPTE